MSSAVMIVAAAVSVPFIAILLHKARKHRKPYRKKVISIFTRFPSPGVTKTRLIPCLGEEGASYAQRRMTEHIMERMKKYCRHHDDTDIAVWYNGSTEDNMRYWLIPKSGGDNFMYFFQQPPGGLGEKLREAALSGFRGNREYVVIIGSDIPGLDPGVMEEAFDALGGGTEMVLGQAEDGGYFLVGFSKAAVHKIGAVFDGIDWGTEKVFQQQCAKAKELDINLKILNTKLSDVDTEEDLSVLEGALQIHRQNLTDRKWSVIVPTMNEEENIIRTLQAVCQNCSSEARIQEIIVCDGGSKDNTVQKVKDFSQRVNVPVKVTHSQPGGRDPLDLPSRSVHVVLFPDLIQIYESRGFQLKHGVEGATGDFLLFLHSDTHLPSNFDVAAESCLKRPGNVGGSFAWSVDTDRSDGWIFNLEMRILKYFTNRRIQNHELPFGDNAMFTTRHVYDQIGGFQEVYLLEDVLLVEGLWKVGHIGIAEGEPVITSARRWRKWGLFRITGLNRLILFAHYLGVSTETLALWYYGDKLRVVMAANKKNA